MKRSLRFASMFAGLLIALGSYGQSRVSGIGVALSVTNDTVKIFKILPNTPADKAGLTGGLIVSKIDGASTKGKKLKECVDLLRGPSGSKVTMELVDPAAHKTNTVELTREDFSISQPGSQ